MLRSLLGLLVLGAIVACGGDDARRAHYDVFTIELQELADGALVHPGQNLAYRVTYQGDLARNLTVTPTYTLESTGEQVAFPFLPATGSDVDDTRVDYVGHHILKGDFLKRSGRIRIQLQASILATLRGSEPWVVASQSVYVDLHPRLDSVVAALPSQPAPYATPIQLTVTGADLWSDVAVSVTDLDTGATLPGLELLLPFDGTQTSLSKSWIVRAPSLEHVGTHHLALVARYGDLQAQSESFAFEVTHVIDTPTVLLRDSGGALAPPSGTATRLPQVAEIVLRITGTQLAGHEVTVNGGTPLVALSDDQELLRLTPRTADFEDGKGLRTYDFLVESGGMQRRASVTLQRWGFEHCEWWNDSRQLARGETVAKGTAVTMRATTWGFPDTSGVWIFRSPLAIFTVWERDPGGRVDPQQGIDPLNNNDDEVDDFDAEIHGNASQSGWTVEYDEELGIVLHPIHANAAEYYFEVVIEDQVCDSGEVWVYP